MAVCPGVTRILDATDVLAAGAAGTAGVVTGTVLGFVIAGVLIVFGVRFVRRPGAGTGRKVLGVVMIVLGVLFALGGLSSLAGAAGSA